ncbi:hypothetical protein [Amycolatopsis sp. DG1A-15b]
MFRCLHYYNHKRLHSTIGENTPAETRINHYAQTPAA